MMIMIIIIKTILKNLLSQSSSDFSKPSTENESRNLFVISNITKNVNFDIRREKYLKSLVSKMLYTFSKVKEYLGKIANGFVQNCSKDLKHFCLVSVCEKVLELRPIAYQHQCYPCFDL